MLISGKPAPEKYDDQLKVLCALPTSFADFNKLNSDSKLVPEEIKIINGKIYNAGREKNFALKKALLREAITTLQGYNHNYNKLIADFFREICNLNTQKDEKGVFDYEMIADYEMTILHYIKSRNYLSAHDVVSSFVIGLLNSRSVDISVGAVFKKWEETLQIEEKKRSSADYDQDTEIMARMILGYKAEYEKNYPKILEHYSALQILQQGPLVENSMIVGERQVGFSDSVAMSTSEIRQCMVIILRNPQNNCCMMAHFNQKNLAAELKNTVDNFMERFPGVILEARLVGSRQVSLFSDDISEENIEKVLSILTYYKNINVVSADIWSSSSPTAIVYYPKTDSLIWGAGVVAKERQPMQKIISFCDMFATGRPLEEQSMFVAFDASGDSDFHRDIELSDSLIIQLMRDCGGVITGNKAENIYEGVVNRFKRSHILFWASHAEVLLNCYNLNFDKSAQILQEAVEKISADRVEIVLNSGEREVVFNEILFSAKNFSTDSDNADVVGKAVDIISKMKGIEPAKTIELNQEKIDKFSDRLSISKHDGKGH